MLNQRGNSVIILSIIVVLLLSGIIAWIFYSKPLNQSPKNLSQQSEGTNLNSSGSPQTSSNPMGQDTIIKADTSKEGPWNRDLYVALSNDGKDFRDAKVFEEKSGVPSAVHDKTGKLFAAFQWFPDNNAQAFDKVAIKTSVDGGQT